MMDIPRIEITLSHMRHAMCVHLADHSEEFQKIAQAQLEAMLTPEWVGAEVARTMGPAVRDALSDAIKSALKKALQNDTVLQRVLADTVREALIQSFKAQQP